ncbi:hypothetical protein [Agromyces bauzanensis]|uniref:Uncharacterized protein n=1 Tax=Agromyces bauzanensis TaxID=1308924 RepID=A0A917UX52_9MICO|nr:hypothetical protein [Agromyces bauzanensis]GGJ91642.1 hypothetical protein GCM10011372_32650 [Agromyces bauzanensis]
MTLTVASVTDCSSVCSADAPAPTDAIVVPEGYTPARLELPISGEPGRVQFVLAPEEVSQGLSFGVFGDVTATSTFTVASAC